ncbi:MAG: GNAT family N-acetyltransferase [Anaerolineales bacterium]
MRIRIDLLANHPEVLPNVAQWAYAERGHQQAGHSLEDVKRVFKERMNFDHPPITVVAFEEYHPIGPALLRIRELESYPEYEFWLGSVFVSEVHRGKGIGSILVNRIEELGREMDLEEIYLHTRRNEDWYFNRDWEIVEHLSHQEYQSVIMRKKLAA